MLAWRKPRLTMCPLSVSARKWYLPSFNVRTIKPIKTRDFPPHKQVGQALTGCSARSALCELTGKWACYSMRTIIGTSPGFMMLGVRWMHFNAWWKQSPKEVYWLEVTDRNDLGVDLNAPRFREDGNEYYGYSLIQAVSDSDIVFHYHKRCESHNCLVSCCRASYAKQSSLGSTWHRCKERGCTAI